MYTVTNTYYGTGEGITYMVLFTKGYGTDPDRSKNALATFERHFGAYQSTGAVVREGLVFEFGGSRMLVGDLLRAQLEEWATEAGGLEYHASIHVNFS